MVSGSADSVESGGDYEYLANCQSKLVVMWQRYISAADRRISAADRRIRGICLLVARLLEFQNTACVDLSQVGFYLGAINEDFAFGARRLCSGVKSFCECLIRLVTL